MDPTLILLVLVIGVMIFFMWRNNKKRQSEARELSERMQVGVDVMTNFGLFGTIIEIDEDENSVLLESTPGTVLRVHRQTVTRIVTPAEPIAEDGETLGEGVENEHDVPIVNGEPTPRSDVSDQDPGKTEK